MILLIHLLELEGDNGDKRKAGQYQERTHEKDHLRDWQEFLCLQQTKGSIRHATGKVKYDMNGTFFHKLYFTRTYKR